jgi:GDSL-like lipase/acylhydrolase family protein
MKRLLGRLVLVVVGVVTGLALIEVGLRLMPPASSRDLRGLHELRPGRPWLYGMRPGASIRGPGNVLYSVNADGFRDRLYARPKPPGTFRIVVLGHSVAFGWAVAQEDTYPKVLEARLAELGAGVRFEVLNLGVCGYNAYTEAALFTDVGVTYQPDLVLVEFGINDLNDPTLHFDAQTILQLRDIPDAAFPNPGTRYAPPPPLSRAARLCRASRLCTMLADRPSPLPDAELLKASAAPHKDPSPAELVWLHDRYADIARAAAGIGARFAVVVFPYSIQLDASEPHHVQDGLLAIGREGGWPVIDLLPALRAAAPGRPPLFLELWHPSVVGNRVVAETIATALRCRGLIPVPPGSDCGPGDRP